jgi:hypothetical protein
MLLMLACCLIPIGAIVAMSVLKIPTTGLMPAVIALMCPAMMLLMLFGMRGGHREQHEQHRAAPVESKKIGNRLDHWLD